MATSNSPLLKVAVIGAGIAGATCAKALGAAGHSVRVFDKSRGAGGRLATRRAAWVDSQGQARTTRFDHGTPGFTAISAKFQRFASAAVEAGWLAEWSPTASDAGLPLDELGPLYVPLPDMSEICRQLLCATPTSWGCAVDALSRGSQTWQIQSDGKPLADGFDAVVLAVPPAQASPLLAAHHREWARHAALALMQPCWTLMGVASLPRQALDWDVARPKQGALAWLSRNEARPGREQRPGEVHWVLHARPGWSRQHLERPAAWVQAEMQSALAEWLGEPVCWQHAAVHRWRYAMPHAPSAQLSGRCWWDAGLGLGVCGDFLGGNGVEGVWLSAHALVDALRSNPRLSTAPRGQPVWREPVPPVAA